MFKEDEDNERILLGRTVKDIMSEEGKIISAFLPKGKTKWEVTVRFKDKIAVLDTRFTLQEWLDNSY